jgi:hypothetical protein
MGEEEAKPESERDAEAVGLACVACGCRDLRVGHTRRYLNVIVRERLCRHCGRKTFTREVVR